MTYTTGLHHCKRVSIVVCLWVLFSLSCFVAPFVAIGFVFYPRHTYMRRFVKAADRMVAALLGFSGRFMLSTEVAFADQWKWLHDALNMIQQEHCEIEVFEEGAYCRIRDRELGIK